VNYLRGPNIWTYRPVLEAWLDLGELEDFPSNKLPGFNERLCPWLPAWSNTAAAWASAAASSSAWNEGTWAGHILEHVVIELLNLAGMPTGFGRRAAPRSTASTAWCSAPATSRSPAPRSRRATPADGRDQRRAFDVQAAVAQVRENWSTHYLGPSTAATSSAGPPTAASRTSA
jgi:cyanophycin synthetase